MKLLFISRFIPYIGGREILLQNILHALAKTDDVYLLTPDVGYHTSDFKIFNFKTEKQIYILIKKIRPDIINIHTFYFAKLALRASKERKIPLILTLHGLFLGIYDDKYRNNLRKIITKSDLISVVCNFHRKKLIEFGVDKNKIVLIKNGINLEKVNFKSYNRNQIRKIFNLPVKENIIITSARLTPVKGLEYLISALPKIRINNYKLLISTPFGRYNKQEMQYANLLLEKAEELGVKNKIIIQFHENSAMPFLYKASDIFVLPSLIEGTPLSLLEAMGSKLPCIATHVGGVKEILKNNSNGYVVPSKNIKRLAEALNKAFSANNFFIKKNAYNTIKNDFNEKRMFAEYKEMYNKLIT